MVLTSPHTDTTNGIIYTWNATDTSNKRVRVGGRDAAYTSTDVTIPDTLDVEQNGSAPWQVWFVGGLNGNTTILSIILPKFLKKIGASAFNGASIQQVDLSECTLLNGVNTSCFANSDIQSIDMTNCPLLSTIGAYTFTNCSNLTKVIMPHVINLNNTALNGVVPVEELNLNSMTIIVSSMLSGIPINTLKILSLNSVTNVGLDPVLLQGYTNMEELNLNSLTSFNWQTLDGGLPTLKTISLNSVISFFNN